MMLFQSLNFLLSSLLVFASEERDAKGSDVYAYFNAIGSALRTNASIKHENGMTIVGAQIARGSLLYHGNTQAQSPSGLDWLAFDSNFAYYFSKRFSSAIIDIPSAASKAGEEDTERNETYLHTYETKDELNLLLIDGLSGVKRETGTLDLQDQVLLNDTLRCEDQKPEIRHGLFCDRDRGARLCELAHDRWNDSVDGFIRKNIQWELIICSFQRSLLLRDVVSLTAGGFGAPPHKSNLSSNLLPYQMLDDSIVQSMVRLDFDRSISAYDKHHIDFGHAALPRLTSITMKQRKDMMNALDRIVAPREISTNWQTLADLLVSRYGPLLLSAGKSMYGTIDEIHYAVDDLLKTHSSLDDPDNQRLVERCTLPYTGEGKSDTKQAPHTPQTVFAIETLAKRSAAQQVISHVARHICQTLKTVREEQSFDRANRMLAELYTRLKWTTWQEALEQELSSRHRAHRP